MKKTLFFKFLLVVSVCLFSLEAKAQPSAPTVQASNTTISTKYTSGQAVSINWTRGNGSACLVVIRKSTSSHVYPSNGPTNYSASGSYGSGSSLGSGDNFVVYKGTGSGVFIYNLAPNTLYDVYVYEYNTWAPFGTTDYYYNTSTSGFLGFSTLAAPPTTCGSSTSVSSVTNSSATLGFAAGNGNGRFVTVCPNGSSATPVSGYYYTPNSSYPSGAAVGSGHVVYGNSGTSVNVTSLTGATTYKAYVYEYTDGTYPTYGTYNYNTRNYYSCTSFTFNTSNIPPTISSVTSHTVCQNTSLVVASLSGIGDGSTNETQNLSITASTNNSTLLPTINVSYASPNTTGYLYIYPANGQYGTAIVTVTVNDGWSVNNTTSTTFTVTVLPLPGPAGAISGSTPICAGLTNQTYSIAPTTNATGYTWQMPSTFTVVSGQGSNIISVSTTTASTSGTMTVFATNSNGCGNGTSSTKAIQVDAQPAAANAGPDQPTVCGTSAVLNATAVSNPDAGVWSWLSGTPVPSIGTTTVNSTSITGLTGPNNTYKYIWTVTRAGSVCPSKRDTIAITTDWLNSICQPAADFAYSPTSDVSSQKICVNTPVNFTDLSVSANSWNWDFNYTGGSPNFTSSLENPVYTYTTAGTYSVYLRIYSNATSSFYNTTKTFTVITTPSTPSTIFGTTSNICEGSGTQYVYSVSQVTDATGYNWATPVNSHIDAYPAPNSIAVSFPRGAVSGTVSVSASNSCGTSGTSTLAVTISPLPNSAGNTISGPATVCQGQNGVTYSISGYTGAGSYTWTDLTGTQSTGASSSLNTNIAVGAVNGTVAVWGNNTCGAGDTVSLSVAVNPLPGAAGVVSGPANAILCPDTAHLLFVVPVIANTSTYNWTVPAGTSITGGNGADSIVIAITTPSLVVGGTNTVSVYGSNTCGNGSANNTTISMNTPYAPQICMVTVDDSSTHNIIYWDKTNILYADSFRIYREDVTNVYHQIGTVPYNSLSEYHDYDPAADPNTTTKRYKISSVDSCGNESALSPYHNTISIIGNGVGQFSWPILYTIENGPNPVNNYVLMVDSLNNGNWVQIASTAGTQQVINDIHYSDYASVANWRVETVWGISCTSTLRMANPNNTQAAVVKSKSNISNNRQTSGIRNDNAGKMTIYPNPTSGIFTINLAPGFAGKSTIKIYSMLGAEVYSEVISGAHAQIDLSNFENGAYTVQVISGAGVMTHRLVKQ
jgi:hypothetical protein